MKWNKKIRHRFNKNQDYIEVESYKVSALTRKGLIMSIVTVLAITIFTLGSSYAIFSDTETSEDYNIVQAGELKIAFDDFGGETGDVLNLNGAFPMSDPEGMLQVPYTFTVTNTGTLDLNYTVKILDDQAMIDETGHQSDLLSHDVIKISIDGEDPMLLSQFDLNDSLITTGSLRVTESEMHSIRMWIDEDAGNEILNKHYHGKIFVEVNNTEILPATGNECFTVESGVITDYNNTCSKDVVIPDVIDGVEITSIANSAFFNKGLTSVYIPNSITNIGITAFASNLLTNIDIPPSVNSIGYSAFNDNLAPDNQAYIYSLNADGTEDLTTVISYAGAKKDITIPSNITNIGEGAFQGTKLTSVIIPDTVTSIGDGAFYVNSLTEIVIPNSVTYLGVSSFRNNNLVTVTLSTSITRIEDYAFRDNKINNLTIPSNVASIGTESFRKNNLDNLYIPDTVTVLGTGAFKEAGITELRISASLKYIATTAFQTNYVSSIVIPEGVTHIYSHAFSFSYANTISLPSTVVYISAGAFYDTNIKTIDLPPNLVTMHDKAFYNTLLEGTITIPSTINYLGADIFKSNRSMLDTVIVNGHASEETIGTVSAAWANGVGEVLFQP